MPPSTCGASRWVVGGALGIVWGLVRGNIAGWTSAEVLGALAGGMVLSVAFVAWSCGPASPCCPCASSARGRSRPGTAQVLTFAGLFGAVFFFAQFLQTGLRTAGRRVRLLLRTATLFVVAPVAGMLVDRFGERLFMSGACCSKGSACCGWRPSPGRTCPIPPWCRR